MSADTLAERIAKKLADRFQWGNAGLTIAKGIIEAELSAAEKAAKEMPSHDDIKKVLGNGWKGFKLNDEDDLDFVIGQIRLAIIKCQAIRNRE